MAIGVGGVRRGSRRRGARLALAGLLLAPPVAAADGDHDYAVTLDAALTRLSVTACLAGGARQLAARDPAAGQYLLYARDARNGERLAVTGGRIGRPPDTPCVDYAVDLRAAAAGHRRYRHLGRGNVAVSAARWLWRPRGEGAHELRVRFSSNGRWQVSVPWTPLAASEPGVLAYTVPPSPQSDDAVTAFGVFEQCEVPVPGGRLRAAVLRGRFPGDAATLLTWLGSAASNVALAYGRFPNPSPQVVVVPSASRHGDDGEPVPFGHVIRDGGEAVQFFVNQQRELDAFLADWTATHEFAHLLLPYVDADEKWISEGLASYYQNVLMARAGAYTPGKAWRKILEGFGRGENSVPHLSLENAMPVGGWDGIMKTYWGGAAVFLFADMALRAGSDGTHSLDTVLERLQACCLPSTRTWSGRRLFRKLDALAPFPVFESLYDAHRTSRAFPDYRAAMAELGLSLRSGRLRFDDAAPLAAVREAIMARRAVPAQAVEAPRCAVTPPRPLG